MSKNKFFTYISAVALAITLLIVGCGTKKKSRDDLSLLGKVYHNTTALYNGYFNANEIMEATYLNVTNKHQDNYTQLLPIFPYEEINGDDVKAELDRAIEKVSIVAKIHEPSVWRDDCYVLLCEAQYLQQDYETAEASLRYTVNEFDPLKKAKKAKRRKKSKKEKKKERKEKEKEREKDKKRRKKGSKKRKRVTREERAKIEAKQKAEEEKARLKEIEEKAKQAKKEAEKKDGDGFMQHRPVFQDAVLWLAKTYTKRDKFSLADSYFRRLEEDPAIHDEVREHLHAARAQYYIEQDRWDKAERPLERAVVHAPDRASEARYAYILAQIKEKKGNFAEAEVYFDKAIKLRPKFDMIFNARLRKAVNAQRSGKISSKDFADEMDDMLKDDKYDEYQDQIYSALAEIEFKKGNKEAGIAFLQQALSSGDKSSLYKAEAFYTMANFFFEDEQYIEAKLYYDSTLTAMTDKDERRPEVEKLSTNLTEIANQLQIIALQDSLIKLSQLPREELVKRAREMQEAEEVAEAVAANGGDLGTVGAQAFRPQAGTGIGKSTFFAYDALIRDKGFRDFKKKWDDRPLEDNWRRSNKAAGDGFVDEEEEEDERPVATEDDQLIEKYFSEVPFEEADLELALKTKEGAMFILGKLYRDKMGKCESSTEVLTDLIENFPGTDKRLDAMFYLYLCALDMNNGDDAEKYAGLITKEFPGSLYAKSISDPDFLQKEKDQEKELDTYYRETYALFSDGAYDQVRSRLDQVDNLYKNKSNLTAKFALLNAMMLGQAGGKESYINGLRDVIAKHKETPEATRAREIMRFLQGDKEAFKVVDNGTVTDSKFTMEEDKLHYVIVVIFDLGKSKLNTAKVAVSSYNRKFHKKDRLNLSTLDLDIENSTPIILVRKFKDMDKSMDYYNAVMRRKDKFLTSDIQYELYSVSQRNYRQIIKDKSIASYRPFFNQYYLSDDE